MTGCRETKLDEFSKKHKLTMTNEAKNELLDMMSEEFTEGMHFQEMCSNGTL